jgi:hypothetical protein
MRFEAAAAIQLAREPAEHDPRAGKITCRCASKGSLQRGLDRSRHVAVDDLSLARQSQQPSTSIALIRPATDQTTPFEPLQEGRERAGVQVQNLCQLPRVNAREPSDDSDDETLGTRDAERPGHRSGSALKRMIDGPDQAQQLERLADWEIGSNEAGVVRDRGHRRSPRRAMNVSRSLSISAWLRM